jgi:RNA-directed DNA polymerase
MTTVATPIEFASFARESDSASTVFTFASIWRAYLACRRGKRRSRSTQGFELQLLDGLVDLQNALQARRFRPSPATAFVVDRPKRREV